VPLATFSIAYCLHYHDAIAPRTPKQKLCKAYAHV